MLHLHNFAYILSYVIHVCHIQSYFVILCKEHVPVEKKSLTSVDHGCSYIFYSCSLLSFKKIVCRKKKTCGNCRYFGEVSWPMPSMYGIFTYISVDFYIVIFIWMVSGIWFRTLKVKHVNVPLKKATVTWICLRCLEKVKSIIPNGGLMVIYRGIK